MLKRTFLSASILVLSGCSDDPISASAYGDSWAFTVDSVVIGCDAMGLPYVDAGSSGTYGLTGLSVQKGYPPVDPIWKDNPEIPGTKVSLSPFIQLGLKACEDR